MTKAVEFLFDFGSPTSYLAYKQLPKIASRHGARIVWTPILLGAVFKATGNSSPAMVPAKARYMNQDLARFAKRYNVVLNFNTHFPVNTLSLMRGAVAYQATDDFDLYVNAMFDAMWAHPRNLNDQAEVAHVLRDIGIDPDDFLARVERADVKEKLKANTEAAIARGVFGAPAFFVNGDMFFGQDRLDFVEEALLP
ncbi:MAG: 2-hydroxychromene-2-carboxylate isomerase [Alphaproteobacteria bacterium]|nr:2-hydroxychromene-2-carboxylate isomerase [Alphaproteobacteria bacterium]